MTVRKDTLFERYLAPLFEHVLLDRQALMAYRRSKDWEQEGDRLRNPTLVYPDYYQSQHFHGVSGGYLNPDAAVTYDAITQYVLPPNELWIRKSLIERIQSRPRRILDIGCGTGSTTLLLKQAFPQAEVIGLDLSPYMLLAAKDKAKAAHQLIQFVHGNAEQTGLPDGSIDLVTATLLFHETPPAVSQTILREMFRLLRVGGEVLLLDGNQAMLRHSDWLTDIFEEPYIQAYAAGSLDAWLGQAGFGAVQTEDLWLVHQISRGVKPLESTRVQFETPAIAEQPGWAMG
ncbi:MAG: class I SAM-dependent methyltransferase [Kaiparowitsia implicata GSE-PSE-MK54-09C]|jgi:ubiquinone/menaquinone biosynthesis C-methylase UbiE|nr:class I SAM-dependent methyltransferase [Kaiparowitsia implicata GSE-PSE-MK54-09C]